MAYTTTDLDAIKSAIAGAQLSVRIGDRVVVYRSLDELIRAKRMIESELSASAARLRPRYQRASFAD